MDRIDIRYIEVRRRRDLDFDALACAGCGFAGSVADAATAMVASNRRIAPTRGLGLLPI
jgi:hypothetical protein